MDLKTIAEPALVFRPDETVSKVASEMKRRKRFEALLLDKGSYIGMVTARDLTKRKINDPHKVKVSSLKSAVKKLKPFTASSEPRDIIDAMMMNGYHAVPFEHGGKFFFITKLGLVKLLPKEALKGQASDVMVFPNCITKDDTLGTARSILREVGTSHLIILSDGKADGIMDTIDLLGAVIGRERSAKGDLAEEKIDLDKISASSPSLSQSGFLRISPDTPLKEVAQKLSKTGNPIAVVEDKKFRGIVTPDHLLKRLSKEVSGVLVRIIGQEKEDNFIRSVIDEEIRNEIKKLAKFLTIDYFVIDIDRHKAEGTRIKYALKAKLITNLGMFFVKAHAWDLTKAMHELLDKLDREVERKKGKEDAKRPRFGADVFA